MSSEATKNDPAVRDRKALPMANIATTVPTFLLYVTVVTPAWLMLIVPPTALYQIGQYTYRAIAGKPSSSGATKQNAAEAPVDLETVPREASLKSTLASRPYDLIIFGATGFTGKMAAKYLARKCATDPACKALKWAIAGRRQDALEKVKSELAKLVSDTSIADRIGIIIADSAKEDSIDRMTQQTRVVCTTAGPFCKYGSSLVKYCAVNGTHYCDITGETDWVRMMIDKYDDAAAKSGAKIVPFCGHDCVPWDLLVFEIDKKLKEVGDVLSEVRFYDEIRAAPSGGTLDTVFTTLSDRIQYKSRLGFDPLLKMNSSSAKSSNRLITKNVSYLTSEGTRRDLKKTTFLGPFVMAMVMGNCVRRSNALNDYGPKIIYREGEVYPSFFAGYVNIMNMLVFGTMLFCPPMRHLLQHYLVPKPGSGPSEQEMDEGFLKITGVGVGSSGALVRAVLYFPTDPGYRDTARMLVESGLVLAQQSAEIKSPGGIRTPASCQGALLLDRLTATGCSLTVSIE